MSAKSAKLHGWKRLPGPYGPSHVWEHESGVRCIPVGPNLTCVTRSAGQRAEFHDSGSCHELKKAIAITGSRRRGGLLFASTFIKEKP